MAMVLGTAAITRLWMRDIAGEHVDTAAIFHHSHHVRPGEPTGNCASVAAGRYDASTHGTNGLRAEDAGFVRTARSTARLAAPQADSNNAGN